MIDEIPEYGTPRRFLNKWTANDVRDMNISRCGKCGSRVEREQDGRLCTVCDQLERGKSDT